MRKKEEKLLEVFLKCVSLNQKPDDWDALIRTLATSLLKLYDCMSQFNSILKNCTQYDDLSVFFQEVNFSVSGIYYYFRKTSNAYDFSFGNIVPDQDIALLENYKLPLPLQRTKWLELYNKMTNQLKLYFKELNFKDEYNYVPHPLKKNSVLLSSLSDTSAILYADFRRVINAIKLISQGADKPFEWVDQLIHIYVVSDQQTMLNKLTEMLRCTAHASGLIFE